MFDFISSICDSKPITRDCYITGKEFNESSDHKNYYSFKTKQMTVEDLLDAKPDFCSLNRLYVQGKLIPKDCDIVKLIVNDDSRLFVESYESLGDCTNVSGIIVPMRDMR